MKSILTLLLTFSVTCQAIAVTAPSTHKPDSLSDTLLVVAANPNASQATQLYNDRGTPVMEVESAIKPGYWYRAATNDTTSSKLYISPLKIGMSNTAISKYTNYTCKATLTVSGDKTFTIPNINHKASQTDHSFPDYKFEYIVPQSGFAVDSNNLLKLTLNTTCTIKKGKKGKPVKLSTQIIQLYLVQHF